MNMTFFPSRLEGNVTAPASKSEAHRQMICAGLTAGSTTLSNYSPSKDMDATMNCLASLGTEFHPEGSTLTIWRENGDILHSRSLPLFDCGESGSTLRFFVPVSLALTGGGVFRMCGRLGQRPMDIYRDLFVPRGVMWHTATGADGSAQLVVSGKLHSDEYVLPGNVSSQFVSGLLFALPMLEGTSRLTVLPPVESASYISMTIAALEASGITLQPAGEFSWIIPGSQRYKASSVSLSGDWSQAAVLLCASALGNRITVQGMEENSVGQKQGDAAIVDCLKQLGAVVDFGEKGITVTGGSLHGCTFDMQGTPDIAPILALVCQLSEGTSRLTGCGRLRMKECDRLSATVEILNALGGNAHEDGDTIVIEGVRKLRGGAQVSSHGDHRMVMLAAVAGSICENPVTVTDWQSVSKSWPGFIDCYRSIGGKCIEVGVK